MIPPKGKHFFGIVSVEDQGQIAIPQKAREVFNVNVGDKLIILGDEERGIGIVHQIDIMKFVGEIGIATKK
ncbi:AbrB/MazE/SpoVT family DNA-binding domain-containing protein [Metaclostridioides mangenotii]|uniref:AbrB family looped-hinge helix DNA binding protein n=1 Tax=Metaclostridioides mangenotii TaxID=1540 RepID=A0ABS4EAZ4_9FIRM|nr:AbrB family looped-hinge helix DNA binding protein [Clostridioides mangenotii]